MYQPNMLTIPDLIGGIAQFSAQHCAVNSLVEAHVYLIFPCGIIQPIKPLEL